LAGSHPRLVAQQRLTVVVSATQESAGLVSHCAVDVQTPPAATRAMQAPYPPGAAAAQYCALEHLLTQPEPLAAHCKQPSVAQFWLQQIPLASPALARTQVLFDRQSVVAPQAIPVSARHTPSLPEAVWHRGLAGSVHVLEHVPTLPARSHRSHCPTSQAMSQQKPIEVGSPEITLKHTPERQSPGFMQAWPLPSRQLPFVHVVPLGQVVGAASLQAPPPQTFDCT
jgi:hypothetical protein